jgi:hypothetical protein
MSRNRNNKKAQAADTPAAIENSVSATWDHLTATEEPLPPNTIMKGFPTIPFLFGCGMPLIHVMSCVQVQATN